MLSGYRLSSVSDAVSYHSESLSAGVGYYLAGENQMYWSSTGVEQLGLKQGQLVTPEALTGALSGKFSDRDGQQVDLTGNSKGHRPGFDSTWTPPKTVSIAALMGGDERVVELCRQINQDRIEYTERNLAAHRQRAEGGERAVKTGVMLTATVMHISDREGMPNLHFHNLTANATKGSDGQWRALDNDQFFSPAARKKMDQMSIHQLRAGLEQLGYTTVTTVSKDGHSFELAEFIDLKAATSIRTGQIEAKLKEWGIDPEKASPAQKQSANLATRANKTDEKTNLAELRPKWEKLAQAHGVSPHKITNDARVKGSQPVDQKLNRKEAELALARAVGSLGERGQAFTDLDLRATAVKFGFERTDALSIDQAVERWSKTGQLVERQLAGGMVGWTTPDQIRSELKIKDFIELGRGAVDRPVFGGREEFEKSVQEFEKFKSAEAGKEWRLTVEQKEASWMVTGSTERVGIIQGAAGTGKTASLEFGAWAADRNGVKMVGASATGKAAAGLQKETGMESDTLAGLLSRLDKPGGLDELTKDGKPLVLVLDEGGLASTRDVAKLVGHLEGVQGVKFISMGDVNQLASVGGGNWFSQAQGLAETSVISEQRRFDNASKDVKDSIEAQKAGHFKRSVETLLNNGRSQVLPDSTSPEELYKVGAKAWMQLKNDIAADPTKKDKSVSFVVGTNADRVGVADAIRVELRKAGELTGEDKVKTIYTPVKVTAEEQKNVADWVSSGATGAVAERDYKSLGVSKGDYLRLTSVDTKENSVTLKTEAGKEVKIDFDKAGGPTKFSPVIKEERAFAVGDSVQARSPIGDREVKDSEGKKTANPDRIANGTLGKITGIDRDGATVEWSNPDGKKSMRLSNSEISKIDHGYGRTTVQEQGQSVGGEVAVVSKTAANNMSKEGWYVSITRAKSEMAVVTNAPDLLTRGASQSVQNKIETSTSREEWQALKGQAPQPDGPVKIDIDGRAPNRETQMPVPAGQAREPEQRSAPNFSPSQERGQQQRQTRSFGEAIAGASAAHSRQKQSGPMHFKSNVRTLGIGMMKDRYQINANGDVWRANTGISNIKNSVAVGVKEWADKKLKDVRSEVQSRDKAGIQVGLGQRVKEATQITGLRLAANVAKDSIKWQKCGGLTAAGVKHLAGWQKPERVQSKTEMMTKAVARVAAEKVVAAAKTGADKVIASAQARARAQRSQALQAPTQATPTDQVKEPGQQQDQLKPPSLGKDQQQPTPMAPTQQTPATSQAQEPNPSQREQGQPKPEARQPMPARGQDKGPELSF